MLGKRLTFLAFFSTVFFQVQAQRLDATFDLVRFKTGNAQNMVELYCSVNGNSVVYKKVPGGFQASVALEVQFSDSVGIKHADKLMLKSPLVVDTAKAKPAFNLQRRIFLKNGKYQFAAKMQDVNAGMPVSNIEMPLSLVSPADALQFSDIQLLESYEKTSEKNEYTKSGFKLLSYVSNFYPKGMDALKFYSEIYNAEKALGKDKPMVVIYRVFPAKDNLNRVTLGGQKIMKAAPVNVILSELDISMLASGNYELVVEVRNEENKIVTKQSRAFQRSNPQTEAEQIANLTKIELPPAFAGLDSAKLDLYLLSLKPVANTTEGVFVESVAKSGSAYQKKSYLYDFWQKRSETDPAKAWQEYLQRIIYAEKAFGNQTFRAFETDMGRVYLQYGPPSKINTELNDVNRPIQNSDTKPYQIWQYYLLGNQRNKVFVFMQPNLANSYNLVHSTATGEVANNEWRKLAGERFSGRKDLDRNSTNNRTFDKEGNQQIDIKQPLPYKKN
jgi:GWxTD domain-containing protein